MQLILDTRGLKLALKDGSFSLKTKEAERTIGPGRVSSILITADCLITAGAIELAVEEGIPIIFATQPGKVVARIWSAHLKGLPELRKLQMQYSEGEEAIPFVASLMQMRIERQLTFLRSPLWPVINEKVTTAIQTLSTAKKKMMELKPAPVEEKRNTLMGLEGSASARYWPALGSLLPAPFTFENRSRRPAMDMFNAALNYLYALLYARVETLLMGAGLDPYIGMLHAEDFKTPVLVFDFIEPFRPYAEQFITEKIMSSELKENCFDKKEKEVRLNREGKKLLIPGFNEFMLQTETFAGKKRLRTDHIGASCSELVRRLRKK